MKLGAHLSISKGLPAALAEAERIGATALQSFARNPRGRGETQVPEDAAAAFRKELQDRDWRYVIHAPYYVNVGSGTPNNQRIAREVTHLDLEKGDYLGASGVVVHLGTPGEGNPIEAAVKHTAKTVQDILAQTNASTRLLLETSAGPKKVGSSFEQLSEILHEVGHEDRVGVCFDTCHVFVSGYDIRGDGMATVMDEFDKTVGWDRVDVIHCNDTQSALGGGRDAHYHIGLGEIGDAAFQTLMKDSRVQDKIFILETPKEAKGSNLEDPDPVNLGKLVKFATK